MKRYITLVMLMVGSVCFGVDMEKMIDRLIIIESSGNCNAIGDNGKAVGCLQIHPIMVKDVNRISRKNYTLNDRYSKVKSIEMCKVYFNHYGKNKSEEQLVRKWNGGPRGDTKTATIKYWNRYQGVK